MLFSSIIFVFYFLPIVTFAYYAIPQKHQSARNIALLIASLIFYGWGEPVYILLMIYSIFFNYFMAHRIALAQRSGGSGKSDLVFTVVINLFILGFFKYFGFLMDTVSAIFHVKIGYTALALPIGISFYTFQAMSYIFDVYKGTVKPQKNPLKFGLYLSFFPQLIAGPIVRYRDIEEQIDNRTMSFVKFSDGIKRFIFGLGKKVLLANNLGAIYATVTALPDGKATVLTYWIGIIAYTFQIYFDFSGYSDMAIGLGRMFGFEFMENFNYPYISKTITEFWRRWHMSLSSWFKEYVYIPLGGNRVPVKRHILNLLIVWGLTGLWHGAHWNFVLWGLYFGVFLILEKYVWGEKIAKLPPWAQHVYALFIVVISWVIFSITDFSKMISYLGVMFGIGGHAFANYETLYLIKINLVLFIVSAICSTPQPMAKFRSVEDRLGGYGIAAIFAVFVLSVAYLVYGSYNPFLYFRF